MWDKTQTCFDSVKGFIHPPFMCTYIFKAFGLNLAYDAGEKVEPEVGFSKRLASCLGSVDLLPGQCGQV